jgi:hypothetical protein
VCSFSERMPPREVAVFSPPASSSRHHCVKSFCTRWSRTVASAEFRALLLYWFCCAKVKASLSVPPPYSVNVSVIFMFRGLINTRYGSDV